MSSAVLGQGLRRTPIVGPVRSPIPGAQAAQRPYQASPSAPGRTQFRAVAPLLAHQVTRHLQVERHRALLALEILVLLELTPAGGHRAAG